MLPIRRLQFAEFAAGREFHAARATLDASGATSPHTHDFCEVFYVLEGAGTHEINGAALPLKAGHLVVIRESDRHAFRVRSGQRLRFVNVAYPTRTWLEFTTLAQIDDAEMWAAESLPRTISVPIQAHEECAGAFARVLDAYHEMGTRLALFRFWAAVLPWVIGLPPPLNGRNGRNDASPVWLRQACRMMQDEENQAQGVARLVELSGVSAGHLSRTLKQHAGQTPTEFLNELRVKRAARLLATTDNEIIDIADDCGFENLSYFYRLFRRQYGQSPRVFRLSSRQSVAP